MVTEAVGGRRRGAEEWRALLGRYAQQGGDVAGFCQAEGISLGSFYRWRKVLGEPRDGKGERRGGFIDLGALPTAKGGSGCRLELKLDLGDGLVLQLVRG